MRQAQRFRTNRRQLDHLVHRKVVGRRLIHREIVNSTDYQLGSLPLSILHSKGKNKHTIGHKSVLGTILSFSA